MKFLHVGNKNYVNVAEIDAICDSDSTPAKKRVWDAEKQGKYIDATGGRARNSIIIHKGGSVTISSVTTETLVRRIERNEDEV